MQILRTIRDQFRAGDRPGGEIAHERATTDAATGPCPICSAPLTPRSPSPEAEGGRSYSACSSCGILELHDAIDAEPNTGAARRHGTAKRPGREFAIALFAAEVLGRSGLRVVSWRPGSSADGQRISRIPLIARYDIAVAEHDSPKSAGADGVNVVGIDAVERGSYDIVIASEILQTLTDPADGFAQILRSAGPSGIVVVTTDLYDGSPVAKLRFHAATEHRWFWTIDALSRVAGAEGFLVDVRLPEIAVRRNLVRKRFVFLSRDPQTMQRLRTRFGTEFLAPSESHE